MKELQKTKSAADKTPSSKEKRQEARATAFSDDPKGSEGGRDRGDDSGSCRLSDDGEDSQAGLRGDSKKITKNEKRLLQNRVSAQRFRQKRKNEFENLKDNLRRLIQENEMLRNQVQELNAMLKHQQEIYAAQEVQMQAIQSSLMEMFCKQVLTQNGMGNGGPSAGGNQQHPSQLGSDNQSQQQNNGQQMNQMNNQMQLAQNLQGLFNNSNNSQPGNDGGMNQQQQMGSHNQNQNGGNDLQALQMQLLSNLTGQNGGPQNIPGMMNNAPNHSSPSDMGTAGSTLASNINHIAAGNQGMQNNGQNMQGNNQQPQNELLKNLQNLLDMQNNNQNSSGFQGQAFSQAMLGKALQNCGALNMVNGQQNNLAQMLQNFIKTSGNNSQQVIGNPMGQTGSKDDLVKENQGDDDMQGGDDKAKQGGKYGSGQNLTSQQQQNQNSQQFAQNMLAGGQNQNNNGNMQTSLLMAAIQNLTNSQTLTPPPPIQHQNSMMVGQQQQSNNFDVLSNNGQQQNGMQYNNQNGQQQKNQSPGAFLGQNANGRNNNNDNMSHIGANDQSHCSNKLQQRKNSLNSNNQHLIQKIQQQLKANVQNSTTQPLNNGQLTPLANGCRSPMYVPGPSPNLKPNPREFMDRNLNISQGGLTPRSVNLNGKQSSSSVIPPGNGAFQNIGQQQNKAKMALPIVLVKNGSPKTNNQSQIVTPKSNNGNNNQYGNALEVLLKQLRNNNGTNTPVGGGPSQSNKKNEFNSPLIGGQNRNMNANGNGNGNANGGVNQVLTQILKSQMSSNNGNTYSNLNGLSTPQGFDQISNNNVGSGGHDANQQFNMNSPDNLMRHHEGEPQQEFNQLNRALAQNKFANNFSFVDLNVLPQEQREFIEKSARQLKEASELRLKESGEPQDNDFQANVQHQNMGGQDTNANQHQSTGN